MERERSGGTERKMTRRQLITNIGSSVVGLAGLVITGEAGCQNLRENRRVKQEVNKKIPPVPPAMLNQSLQKADQFETHVINLVRNNQREIISTLSYPQQAYDIINQSEKRRSLTNQLLEQRGDRKSMARIIIGMLTILSGCAGIHYSQPKNDSK